MTWEDTQKTIAGVACGGLILVLLFTLLSSLSFFTEYIVHIRVCVQIYIYTKKIDNWPEETVE